MRGFWSSRRNFLKGTSAALLAAKVSSDAYTLGGRPFNIRTITAGINVSRSDYREAIESAKRALSTGAEVLESAGYVVQTRRIVTQASELYLGHLSPVESEEWVATMQEVVGAEHLFGTGPGVVRHQYSNEGVERALAIARLGVSGSVSLTSESRVDLGAIKVVAEIIKQLADSRPLDNFNFAGIAEVNPGIPFLPAGYNGSSVPSFAIGTEGASLFMRVCAEIGGLEGAERALRDTYTAALRDVEALGLRIETETGWHFAGIDTTPAQWGEQSIGSAIESLTGAPFGAPGTLAACRLLTNVIKSVPVRKIGYRGLFLPPLEDITLAQRAYDHFGLASLLSYSAVCGTGLDAVAIPGNTSVPELERILLDVANLAVRLHKPLTARLFPVPGKSAGEDSGKIGELFSMKVLRVR